MSPLPRLLASFSVAAVVAVAAPAAADAASSVTFDANGTTVQVTDPGSAQPTVHLTVTSDGTADLADTKVLLGQDGDGPDYVVGSDGVHDARYADDVDDQLSTASCVVYDGPVLSGAPVTVAGSSYSVDLPKGVVVAFEDIGVDVGAIGIDDDCAAPAGYHGLATDYVADHEKIGSFAWDAPAAPVVSAAGGRRQVSLTFARERGTTYDIYPVVNGERAYLPVVANLRGDGASTPVVIDADADGHGLEPGTTYTYAVQATREFYVFDGEDTSQPTSPFSAAAGATTNAAQVVRFGAGPAATTTDRNASFAWTIDGNAGGDAPFCLLDPTGYGDGTEVPCTTTGATLTGVALGAHVLYVFPGDGENAYPYRWTVQAPAPVATPAPAPAPAPAPVVKKPVNDLDGDGIVNTWLIGGKPAPAPAAPKAVVSGGKVKLSLPKAPKGATKVRVYRADGKGKYIAVKTVSTKAKSYTDSKAKAGHTYKYKIVAVNAKGGQSAASKAVTAKVAKKKH